jgi:hypothetical protein
VSRAEAAMEAAFLATTYRVETPERVFDLRIGLVSSEFDEFLRRQPGFACAAGRPCSVREPSDRLGNRDRLQSRRAARGSPERASPAPLARANRRFGLRFLRRPATSPMATRITMLAGRWNRVTSSSLSMSSRSLPLVVLSASSRSSMEKRVWRRACCGCEGKLRGGCDFFHTAREGRTPRIMFFASERNP